MPGHEGCLICVSVVPLSHHIDLRDNFSQKYKKL